MSRAVRIAGWAFAAVTVAVVGGCALAQHDYEAHREAACGAQPAPSSLAEIRENTRLAALLQDAIQRGDDPLRVHVVRIVGHRAFLRGAIAMPAEWLVNQEARYLGEWGAVYRSSGQRDDPNVSVSIVGPSGKPYPGGYGNGVVDSCPSWLNV